MRDGLFDLILALLAFGFLILLIVVGPLVVIWALNTLGCHIPYTFQTWVAMYVLFVFFGRNNPAAKTGTES